MSPGWLRSSGGHGHSASVGILLLLTSGACSDDGSSTADAGRGPPSPELPPDTALKDLSKAQAEALCEWEDARVTSGECLQNAILAGGFIAQISADDAT